MPATAAAFGRDTDAGVADEVREHLREGESLLIGPRQGAIAATQTLLVMAHDGADGRLALHDDRIRVEWPGVTKKPVFRRINEALERIVATWGGTYVPNPIWAEPLGNDLITVHPLGGCAMGETAERGVVDHACRVFAGKSGSRLHAGLYVTDGAVMPRSLGVNPFLIISAVAERAMALLATEHGFRLNLGPTPARPLPKETVGVRFTERMAGPVSDIHGTEAELAFVAAIVIDDLERFIADPAHDAELSATLTCPLLDPAPLEARGGRFNLFIVDKDRVETKRMDYQMPLVARDGRRYRFTGQKTIHDDRGFDLWRDTTTLAVRVTEDGSDRVVLTGELKIAPSDLVKQLRTVTATGVSGLAQLKVVGKFGRFFAGEVFDSFGGPFASPVVFDPARSRIRRALRAPEPEVHWIDTRDRKKLLLARYKGGKRGPVILSPGLGVSSLIYAIDTLETNLLEALVGAEFDCWLLDFRTSIALPSAAEPSTADDVAHIDYPTAVAFVREHTRSRDVQMVAHCYGAMTFSMAMLAGLEGVRSATLSQISAHAVVPFWPQRLLAYLRAPVYLRALGIQTVDARATVDRSAAEKFVDAVLGLVYPFAAEDRTKRLTSRRITALYGPLYDIANIEPPHSTRCRKCSARQISRRCCILAR
jgi:cholesterol oxidase